MPEATLPLYASYDGPTILDLRTTGPSTFREHEATAPTQMSPLFCLTFMIRPYTNKGIYDSTPFWWSLLQIDLQVDLIPLYERRDE
jgi:hypothetical protein